MTRTYAEGIEGAVTLAECPPGPFLFNGSLGFKTEYGAMRTVGSTNVPGSEIRWAVSNYPDAYCMDSGEYFWGGTTTHEARAKLMVQPIRTLSTSPSGIEDARETFETVRAWCDETFGPATPESIIDRAAEEWKEMEDATDQDSRAIEAVDVVIILCRMPGFVEAFQRKMAINRARKWRLTGNGTGYHIPDTLCESASSKIGGDHG